MKASRILFIIGFIAISSYSFGQWQLGVKVSPGLTTSRNAVISDTLELTKNASGMRIMAGIVLDFQFQENYYFSTGINFMPKKLGYHINGITPGVVYNDVIKVQYLQLPLTMKLYTNEIALDMRLYFQFGAMAELNVKDNMLELQDTFVQKVGLFDVSIPVAAGAELKLGESTSVFAGIVYHRGFLNQVSESMIGKDIALKMQFIGLEVGVKF